MRMKVIEILLRIKSRCICISLIFLSILKITHIIHAFSRKNPHKSKLSTALTRHAEVVLFCAVKELKNAIIFLLINIYEDMGRFGS